jgi:hypothetical protein
LDRSTCNDGLAASFARTNSNSSCERVKPKKAGRLVIHRFAKRRLGPTVETEASPADEEIAPNATRAPRVRVTCASRAVSPGTGRTIVPTDDESDDSFIPFIDSHE